jgi:hypothetical protein
MYAYFSTRKKYMLFYLIYLYYLLGTVQKVPNRLVRQMEDNGENYRVHGRLHH